VGIGTENPVSSLDVTSAITSHTGLNIRNETTDQRFLLQVNGSSPGGQGREGNFEIWGTGPSGNQNVFTAVPGGCVGIGTTNPTCDTPDPSDEFDARFRLHVVAHPHDPASTEYAAWFDGNVVVNGRLSKNAGSFVIDHPLDPADKYLYHSFVESPDMMNVYNGNIELDSSGEAWVVLPDWFEALNKEFRYQLTAMGGPAPDLHVANEIRGNRFKIAGGTGGQRVSWQVTGVRHDPYAEHHRIPVEEEKVHGERGRYLHPELYGKSLELQIGRPRQVAEVRSNAGGND
jgi:hypothetical protein